MALPDSPSRRPITGPSRATHEPPTQTGWSSQQAAAKHAARRPLLRFAALAVLAVLTASLARDSGPSRFVLAPVPFAHLDGWAEDSVSAAIPAFLKSCDRFS